MYPSFYTNSAEMKKLLEAYPEPVRKALGISLDSFFSMQGFYSYTFLYIMLSGSIQAMNLGLSIISKETRDKTADFLLTKPVTRWQIVTFKLLAALISLIITNIIYLIVAASTAYYVRTGPFSIKAFLMISITLFFVQLIFLAMGVLFAVIFPKIRSVVSVSLGTVFGFFIINMFNSIISDKALRYITPFKYFDLAYIIKNEAYEMQFIYVEIIFIIFAITLSYLLYSKKDIHAV
jgi:ABC-2 type transport system permease protein